MDHHLPRRTTADTHRLLRIGGLLLFTLLAGTAGYMIIMGWNLLDAMYMTVITLTTVGFGEVHPLNSAGRAFTMVLLMFSMGLVAYSVSSLAAWVMEWEFSSVFWRRRMEKQINQLKDHFIVAGYGRTGRAVCDTLMAQGIPFVVIEQRPEGLEQLKANDWPTVDGDATQDESLHRAGIARARSVVAALGNDAENVYLTLSARQLNNRLKIASWASSLEAEVKIRRAGADYVVSPYMLGGVRLVHHLVTPHALEILDTAIRGEDPRIRLEELEIPPASPFVGNSLKTLGIGRDLGVIIIGIRRDEDMLFNPNAETQFAPGDILIAIGPSVQFASLRRLIGL